LPVQLLNQQTLEVELYNKHDCNSTAARDAHGLCAATIAHTSAGCNNKDTHTTQQLHQMQILPPAVCTNNQVVKCPADTQSTQSYHVGVATASKQGWVAITTAAQWLSGTHDSCGCYALQRHARAPPKLQQTAQPCLDACLCTLTRGAHRCTACTMVRTRTTLVSYQALQAFH
jgi:hypothetical protein